MGVTVLIAMVVTAAFGWFVETQYDPRAALAAELQAADDRARQQLLDLGWQPLRTTPGRVEILRAPRPFELGITTGTVRGSAPAAERLEATIAVVERELARYSPGFLRRGRLHRVLVCEKLALDGVPISSLPNFERTLLLDADAPLEFLRRLIHHEVFHFLDYADDDSLGSDGTWQALNDRYFVYGSGGRYLRDGDAARFRTDLPGFVSKYATSALEEDKAELFAFAMSAPTALRALSLSDAVIRAKLVALERQVTSFDPATGDLLPAPNDQAAARGND
jgi:hypothetical protein